MIARFGEKPKAKDETIVLWTQGLADIPDGWALCDGNNGTPNLMDKFLRQPSTISNIGNSGGSHTIQLRSEHLPEHSHSGETDPGGSHDHKFDTQGNEDLHGDDDGDSERNMRFRKYTDETTSAGEHHHAAGTDPTGSANEIDNRPRFIEVAFIMKMP